jgi:hypothetical protein
MTKNNDLKRNAMTNIDVDIASRLDNLAKDLKRNFGSAKPYFISNDYEVKLGENDCLIYKTNTGKTYSGLMRDLNNVHELYSANLDSLINLSNDGFKGRESHLKYIAFIQTQHSLMTFASKVLADNADRVMNQTHYFNDLKQS